MAPSSPGPSRGLTLNTAYSYALAGVGGFNVMLLEMCAFRVLQTEFGSSMYVTGSLLSLVMIALSLGYYVGGRASARLKSVGYLLALLGGAAAYVLVVNLVLVGGILDFCFGLRDVLGNPTAVNGVPPAVATVALYVLPMLALSQTSPFLVGLLSTTGPSDTRAGAVAGNLMAISTMGSIAGSLIPSFILIPRVGVVGTLYVLLSTVVLAVLVGAVLIGRAKSAAVFASVMVVGVLAYAQWHTDASTRGVHDAAVVYAGETPYGNIKILRSQDKDGEEALSYMPSRNYVHTTVYPARPLKEQFTTLHLSLGYARKAKNYLVLGTALGGVVASVVAMDPQAHVTAVEIDPSMDGIARRFVPILNHPNVNLVTADARVFLKETSRMYDYIIVDVFAGQQIPAHCVTQEFFALVYSRLTPDGVAVLNSNLWDFQIGTGLEEPRPFVSVHHVHSALLNAGFASLFHNDFLEHGEVYAFKQPTELPVLRSLLGSLVRDETANVDLRAAAAVAYVGALPVPAERARERPITDEWVPEHELHLKENFEQFLGLLAAARGRPEWERTVHADPSSLRLISARHYARIADTGQLNYKGLEQYMKSEGGHQYCDELFAWAAGHQGPLHLELARYFHGTVATYCAEYAGERAGASRGEKLLLTYMRAVGKIHQNDGAAALSLLSDYIARSEREGVEG